MTPLQQSSRKKMETLDFDVSDLKNLDFSLAEGEADDGE